jgi:hypothetical protein
MATLEFAMALPILLLLIVGITWMGFIVVGRAEVLTLARAKAWNQRFDDKSKRPLTFPKMLAFAPNPRYSANADHATETVTKPVRVSPVFDRFATPTSSHTILAGSWDHRAMPFNKFPEFELIATVAANGIGGDPQSLLSNLRGLSSQLSSLGSTIGQNTASQIANLASGSNGGNSTANSAGAANQATSQNAIGERAKHEQRLRELGGRVNRGNNQVESTRDDGPLGQTIKEIERLEALVNGQDNAPVSEIPEQENQRQADLESNKRQLELMKGKRQRIESDIRDADAELRALG